MLQVGVAALRGWILMPLVQVQYMGALALLYHFLRALSGVWSISIEAGLPNITGKIYATVDNSSNVQWEIEHASSGALYGTNKESQATVSAGDRNYEGYNSLSIDASRSSVIYGASETITPRSLSTKLILKY